MIASNMRSQIDTPFNKLVWSDEFNGSGAIDASKWHHQTLLPNGNSWYNNEVQHYTNRVENSAQINGNLKISAKRENFTDQGVTKNFTSARLNSKFAFTYGRVEVRAKVPTNQGSWPAIWLLGKNINEPGGFFTNQFGTTNWPACGEIDIMEAGIYGVSNKIGSAIHTTSSSGSTINNGGRVVNDLGTNFHLYTMIWTPKFISFALDGQVYYTYNPSTKNASTWPFDAPQYILLNIAMGGVAGSIPAGFSQADMEIDYIRIYQKEEPSVIGDTTPPQNFSATLEALSSRAISLKLKANGETDSISFLIKYGSVTQSISGVSDQKVTVDLFGLMPNTNYSIEVSATDKVGNSTPIQTIAAKTSPIPSCSGNSSMASQGSFTSGYFYSFENFGTGLLAHFDLLDADKIGVVGFLQTQSPFSEIGAIAHRDKSFTFYLKGLDPNIKNDYAARFAFSGGNSVSQNFSYSLNSKCTMSLSSYRENQNIFFNNPAKDFIQFQTSIPIESIRIYQLNGKRVFYAENKENQYDIAHLPIGMYQLEVIQKGQSNFYKLLINQ
jgi:beta-glucanase (GH16 family)